MTPADLRMPLEDAMTTQRAMRRLLPDPVEDTLVLRLIELATKAPSGYNGQNWEFVVIRDRAVKSQFARANRQALRTYLGLAKYLNRKDPPTLRAIAAGEWQRDHFEEIPVLIVACLRGPRPIYPPMLAANYYGSIFPSIQNLLLAARSAGLGAALITMPLWSNRKARKILGLPRSVKPCAMVALGWPRGSYGPTRRKPPEEITHLDRYENRVFK